MSLLADLKQRKLVQWSLAYLAATPHFRARLAEAGLRWPPPQNLPSLAEPTPTGGKSAP